MWAGGEIEWVGRANKLRVGQEVTEITRLVSAKGKRNRSGEQMIVVGVEKKFQNDHGIALIDKR
jgi:hydroxyacyl-ACP dehydratase HTD2-like protein with hotdog domain